MGTITRDDVASYVTASMPHENLDLLNLDAIVQDVIDLLPFGWTSGEAGVTAQEWLDRALGGQEPEGIERFWAIVAKHDLSTVGIATEGWARFAEVRAYANHRGMSVAEAIVALANSGLSHESRTYA